MVSERCSYQASSPRRLRNRPALSVRSANRASAPPHDRDDRRPRARSGAVRKSYGPAGETMIVGTFPRYPLRTPHDHEPEPPSPRAGSADCATGPRYRYVSIHIHAASQSKRHTAFDDGGRRPASPTVPSVTKIVLVLKICPLSGVESSALTEKRLTGNLVDPAMRNRTPLLVSIA